ncbi:hypothetical protein KFK09_009216 [Dendrobium nobile]|uniref:Uncharacterized protein n=1 Tax=Dendrobium nobile TaxID=94219 RepID=A0A8T3BPT2_DENNO|nr:hypothetical protein KFK09_009216 [Dendrobium nobile]
MRRRKKEDYLASKRRPATRVRTRWRLRLGQGDGEVPVSLDVVGKGWLRLGRLRKRERKGDRALPSGVCGNESQREGSARSVRASEMREDLL